MQIIWVVQVQGGLTAECPHRKHVVLVQNKQGSQGRAALMPYLRGMVGTITRSQIFFSWRR
ncbi:hypothetical protein CUC53_15050 [Aeromonas cavernicola]|uniref:Uncharacterized protein n=1 Tax=Aeromonas cavernicola TaxID=1006623 RepID=A0A2H9U202_9GAMM|nr:hypothetical protein CUC53_15050 [Aeromonas cavernicola]